MSANQEKIIERLKILNLLETSELVRQIEETFNVDATFSISGIVVPPTAEGAPSDRSAEAEKTTFDVILESIREDKRVASLKAIRSCTTLGLREAKDFCSSLPNTVKEGVSREEAETIKSELEKAGGRVRIS